MFTHIDVNFYIKYEGHQNWSKILSMDILRVLDHHHIWCQNWHQYVWTLLCQFNFFLWTSSIVYVFDFLTFDIFLTTRHLFDNFFWHMGNRTYGQWEIMVNTLDRDGAPWGRGHMGDGAHGIFEILWFCGGSMKNSKKDVKNMSKCQTDVKMSKRCQMSKSQTHRLWRRFTKKNKFT